MPPHPTSWRSILIIYSHLCLGLPSGLSPSGPTTKIQYAPLLSAICATCPYRLFILDFIIQITFDEAHRSWHFTLCSLLHSSVTSSLLSPNILLSTLFLYILSLCSSLNVRDQVSYPYKTTGKIIVLYRHQIIVLYRHQIIVLYVLIFTILEANWKTKDSALNDSKYSLPGICWFFQEYLQYLAAMI